MASVFAAVAVVAAAAVLRVLAFRLRAELVRGVDATDWTSLEAVPDSLLRAHYLDVDDTFVRECAERARRGDAKFARVASLARYMSAIKWNAPRVTVFHVLATWCCDRLWQRWPLAVVLGLLPSSLPGLSVVVSANGHGRDALQRLDDVLGANAFVLARGVFDAMHYVRGLVRPPFTRAPANHTEAWAGSSGDAVAKLMGDCSLAECGVRTAAELHRTSLVLTRHVSDPTAFVYETPRPLCESLLPGLCLGTGGLSPLQSPLRSARNALVCDVLNRLSSNAYVAAGVAPDGSGPFEFRHEGRVAATPKEFCEMVPGLRIFFSRHSSAFGFYACLRDAPARASLGTKSASPSAELAEPPRTPTTTNERARLAYTQIPIGLPCRLEMRDPVTGHQFGVLSYHSALIVQGDDTCPLGEFRAQFYLGPDGCTSWKPGDELLRPWAPMLETPMPWDEGLRAVHLAGLAACASNWAASRVHRMDMGGYGLHGTCSDSTGLLQQVLFGRVNEFPLYGSGDAKSAFVFACKSVLAPGLTAAARLDDARALDELARAALKLPNDLDHRPVDLPDIARRMHWSLLGEFACVKAAPALMDQLIEDWKRVM